MIKLKAGNIPEVIVKLEDGPGDTHQATLVAKDASKEVTYTVVRTYGGWGWKQRYQVKIGKHHYILPFQWNQATSRWVPYNLQNWYKEDGSLKTPAVEKSFEMSCAGCHNTGLELKKVDPGYESKYVDLNLGCENCHGPGSQHVKSPKTKGNIIHPRKLPSEEVRQLGLKIAQGEQVAGASSLKSTRRSTPLSGPASSRVADPNTAKSRTPRSQRAASTT